MDKNTGGPAFPHTDMEWVAEEQQWKKPASTGMTLRDYFAAKAMQAIVPSLIAAEPVDANTDAALSKAAYLIANAMLKARDE